MEDNKKPGILEEIKGAYFTSNPYLSTRVLASVSANQRRTEKAGIWRRFAVTGLFAAVATLAFLTIHPRGYQPSLGKPFAVHLTVDELDAKTIAEIEVELPTLLNFYSKGHPELAQLRILKLNYQPTDPRVIPIVLTASSAGRQSIKLRYYGSNRVLLAERDVDIKVRGIL